MLVIGNCVWNFGLTSQPPGSCFTAPGPPKRKIKKKENRFWQKLVRKTKKTRRRKLGVREKKKTLAQNLEVKNKKENDQL